MKYPIPSTPNDNKCFLTETQLAKRWQVSKKLIQKQRQHGTGVPFVRLGGRIVRYRIEEVCAFEEAALRMNTCVGGEQ